MTNRLTHAFAFAHSMHRKQLRKGNDCPFIAHPMAVASLVLETGGSEDECIAALLHDTVEDGKRPGIAGEIRRRFGDSVADMVCELTEERRPGMSWRERKETSIARVAEADPSVLLVLSADKLHNVVSLAKAYRLRGERIWKRFRGGRAGTLWYYRAMADAIEAAGSSPLLGELRQAVDELEDLVAARAAA